MLKNGSPCGNDTTNRRQIHLEIFLLTLRSLEKLKVILVKYLIENINFGKNQDVCQKFESLVKNSKVWLKIEMLVKNQNFGQKSKLLSQIKF